MVAISTGVMVLFSPLDECRLLCLLRDRCRSPRLPLGGFYPHRGDPRWAKLAIGEKLSDESKLFQASVQRPSWPLWFWYAPPLYDLALKMRRHIRRNICCFWWTGLLYWRPLLDDRHFNFLASNAKHAALSPRGRHARRVVGSADRAQPARPLRWLPDARSGVSGKCFGGEQLGGMIMWFSGPVFYVALTPIIMNGDDLTGASATS